MLVYNDSSALKRLNEREALDKFREENDKAVERFLLPEQDSLTNALERMGSPMQHTELINKVLKLNCSLWVEDSINVPNGAGFYMQQDGKKVCLNAAFIKGWLPEFTLLHVNDRRLVTGMTVGWRDVLKRLLAKKVLTMRQVRTAFGDSYSDVAKGWLKATRYMR